MKSSLNETELRATAEAQLLENPRAQSLALAAEAPLQALLHELQVHQIELEMQNEALRQAQVELAASRDRYVDLYEFAPLGYLTLDSHGLITQINLIGAALLGRERKTLLQKRFASFVVRDDQDRWTRHCMGCTSGKGRDHTELSLQRGDGTLFLAQLECMRAAADGGLRLTLTDITERRLVADELARLSSTNRELKALNEQLEQARAQLLQSEKMAAIGQLAAGVAHEINNPLSFVHANFAVLGEYLTTLLQLVDAYRLAAECAPPDQPALLAAHRLADELDLAYLRNDALPILGESQGGLARVKCIVRDLLDFSHVDEGTWQSADLHQCIEGTLNVIRNELKDKVTLIKEYGELPLVSCRPAQLSQMFMNLLINAAQSIDEQGTITLRSGGDNDSVWVEVIDTGSGIAPEVLPRIFEPFFTTKPVGSGTGLGMAVSYGIVQKHKGKIEVRSEVGHGTTFRVSLPVCQETLG
jgi:two-component system NtrC family sensor kinase